GVVGARAPLELGARRDAPGPFELPEALREQGTGEPGRALQDLAEASAAEVEVADDQRCPALGEDLGATSDGAVLAVRPHHASVAHPRSVVKSRFLTLRLSGRSGPMVSWRAEGTMTTPTTADVSHGSMERTIAAIDGFRGRLISADHADYDIARAVWNGAIDRRPRLIARCIGTADVIAAVRFARDHDLEIAIRGGGHNVAGTAHCDYGSVTH